MLAHHLEPVFLEIVIFDICKKVSKIAKPKKVVDVESYYSKHRKHRKEKFIEFFTTNKKKSISENIVEMKRCDFNFPKTISFVLSSLRLQAIEESTFLKQFPL